MTHRLKALAIVVIAVFVLGGAVAGAAQARQFTWKISSEAEAKAIDATGLGTRR